MTISEAKSNIGKKVICEIDNKKKEGVIVSVGMHVFVKLDDYIYYKAVPSENIELAEGVLR